MIKRLIDIVASFVGLAVITPLCVVIAIAIKIDSRGPVFFSQERIGRGFRPFRILKFRSMTSLSPRQGALQITVSGDKRVTRVGRFLRRSKLDELPQLVNVLRGEMSLVGPRPEVHKYVEMFRRDYETILRCRPGITDLASITYRDEERILAAAADPEREYVEHVLPEKIALAKQYVRDASLRLDANLLARTLLRIVRHERGENDKR